MSGQAAYVGALSLGQACPVALAASAQLSASVGLVLPGLQAQLTGLLALQASIAVSPPSLATNLSLAQQLVAGLTVAISAGLPGVDFQALAVAGQLAAIQAQIGSLSGVASLGGTIAALLGAVGVYVYAYSGTADGIGPAMSAATSSGFPGAGGPSQPSNAIVLATVTPATWAAMQTFFKTG